MAEQGTTTFVFNANTKPAEDSLDLFSGKIGQSVIALNQGFELISKTANLTAKAIEKAFDLAKAGEEIVAIGTRFEILSKQMGLVPESLQKGIESAVHGTVDMEDALKAASQAMVSLERNGERIPQIFEVAKKAAALFGGDVVERFNQISQAVASGSTRQLRDIGIIIDAQKAYENYAYHVNTTADKLSLAQKQQAILNEVLKKGNSEFKNINESLTPLNESMKRMQVSFGEVGDSIALVVNNKLGPALKTFISSWGAAFDGMANKIKESFLGVAPSTETVIARLKAQITDLQNLQKYDPLSFNAQNRQVELDQLKQKLIVQESLLNQQNTINAQKQTTAALYNAEAESNAKANAEKERELNLLRQAQGQYEEMMSISGAFAGAAQGFAEGLRSIGVRAQEVGKTMATTFKQGLTNSFAAMGAALVKGQNVMDAFASAMLGVLGDLALQLSAFFMAQGIALLFSIGGTAQGVALIAAAAGLAVLGGALKAMSGGGGGVGASPTTPAYTQSVGYSDSNYNTPTPENERVTPQTGVQVVVQGNVFDSRETGLQIAQIINDSFDLNGTMIRANA